MTRRNRNRKSSPAAATVPAASSSEASICKRCQSHEFETIGLPNIVNANMKSPDGRDCNQVVKQRVRCLGCKQIRMNESWMQI